MPLYIVVNAHGRQQRLSSVAQEAVEPLLPGETLVIDLTHDAEPTDKTWDPATLVYVVPVTPTETIQRTRISKREFRNRLGQPMRLAILALRRSTDPAKAQYRDLLEDMKETLDSVDIVDLENADTIAGVNGLAYLASIGELPAIDPVAVLAPSTVWEE